MGLRRIVSLVVFSIGKKDLLTTLELFCKERLTHKQKKIIEYSSISLEQIAVTKLVHHLAELLRCSRSAVWNNLRQLKRIGLLQFGDVTTKGAIVRLSPLGKLLAEKMQNDKNGGEENDI